VHRADDRSCTGTFVLEEIGHSADGDYTVQLTVTTYDGRSASTTRLVPVGTHVVAITRFKVPHAANANQTRPIVVGLISTRYPEQVRVQLYKSVPGGFEQVGNLTQEVAVQQSNRTTNFRFSHTFTSDDAAIGKVTLKAAARIYDGTDAIPADNRAVSSPTKVSR
jgi:hypothetical protein